MVKNSLHRRFYRDNSGTRSSRAQYLHNFFFPGALRDLSIENAMRYLRYDALRSSLHSWVLQKKSHPSARRGLVTPGKSYRCFAFIFATPSAPRSSLRRCELLINREGAIWHAICDNYWCADSSFSLPPLAKVHSHVRRQLVAVSSVREK